MYNKQRSNFIKLNYGIDRYTKQNNVENIKRKQQKREYYLKHKKELYEKTKLLRKKNPERYKKSQERFRKENPNYHKEYQRNHPKKEHQIFRSKMWVIGLNKTFSFDDYKKLLEKQKNVCAICGGKNNKNRRLAVDHDHKSGKVRGLLCWKCNTAIGLLNDDIGNLKSAIKYLLAKL